MQEANDENNEGNESTEDTETGGDQMNTEIKMQVKIEGRKGKKRKCNQPIAYCDN